MKFIYSIKLRPLYIMDKNTLWLPDAKLFQNSCIKNFDTHAKYRALSVIVLPNSLPESCKFVLKLQTCNYQKIINWARNKFFTIFFVSARSTKYQQISCFNPLCFTQGSRYEQEQRLLKSTTLYIGNLSFYSTGETVQVNLNKCWKILYFLWTVLWL